MYLWSGIDKHIVKNATEILFKIVSLNLLVALMLSACSLPEIKKQAEVVSSLGELTGAVIIDASVKKDGPVHVVLFIKENGYFDLVDHDLVGKDGKYKFYVTPGDYTVAAYIDSDNDELYQDSEPATYMGIQKKTPEQVRVNANEKVAVEAIQISGIIKHKVASSPPSWESPNYLTNIGRIVSLDDPMFKRENASMGLWRPLDFIESIGGGLFMLQEFEDEKVPVLFIHGISGTPIEWKQVISSMDKEKFQPWVLYYPSGVGLDMVSDYLVQSVNTLEKRYNFKQLGIVAHSMGGLVMRSYVMKHNKDESPLKITFAMSVNSPMAGLNSARLSVKHSPIVVTSWRDVAKDSAFIQTISAWDWPVEIPYHLVFTYKTGEGDDGVVSLDSQIPSKLQHEAVKIYGFNSSHAGVLQDAGFITRFNAVLDRSLK